jgi:hypothetical protein
VPELAAGGLAPARDSETKGLGHRSTRNRTPVRVRADGYAGWRRQGRRSANTVAKRRSGRLLDVTYSSALAGTLAPGSSAAPDRRLTIASRTTAGELAADEEEHVSGIHLDDMPR